VKPSESAFENSAGKLLVEAMAAAIQKNAAWLSEIDGAIGDGDHGVNMNKGFSLALDRLQGRAWDLTEGLKVLSQVLLDEIGGAMGPLYGVFFLALAEKSQDHTVIDDEVFGSMLASAQKSLKDLGEAEVGDKTLMDTLSPAIESFEEARLSGAPFRQSLDALMAAAEKGKESTKSLVAKRGRASRLGERSRGTLDAGAVSCWLLLQAMAQSSQRLLAS